LQKFSGAQLGFLDDVGIEPAAQALVSIHHHQQVALAGTRSAQQQRRGVAADLARQRCHHARQPRGIGARGLRRGLRLAQLRRGDHLLRLGDLLRRLDRFDTVLEFLEAGHFGSLRR